MESAGCVRWRSLREQRFGATGVLSALLFDAERCGALQTLTLTKAALNQVFRVGSHSCSTLQDAQDGFEGREGHWTPFASAGILQGLSGYAKHRKTRKSARQNNPSDSHHQ